MAYKAASRKRVEGAMWFGGRILPKSRRVCEEGQHYRLVGTRKYEEFDCDMWRNFGECWYCGSTVHVSQTRQVAA